MSMQNIRRFIFVFIIAPSVSVIAQVEKVDTISVPDQVMLAADIMPRGIYAIPKPPFDNAPTKKTWKNECLDGVKIRRLWKELNPDSLVYDWVELDSMFLLANQFSKKYTI